MSIPLLAAVSAWARGKCPVRVLLASRAHAEILEAEGLAYEPLYSNSRLSILATLVPLVGRTGLVIGVPQVPAKTVTVLKRILRSRYAAAEAFAPFHSALSHAVPKTWTKPILQSQQELLLALGIPQTLQYPKISITHEERAWSSRIFIEAGILEHRPKIAIHCSSQEPSKQWPIASVVAALLEIVRRWPSACFIAVGGRSDLQSTNAVQSAVRQAPWLSGVGTWSIRQTLAVLLHCDVLISGDTGPMHMAAALGRRTISVFGPTSARRVGPTYNGGVALTPGTECHPCYKDVYCSCSCIAHVRPETVIDSVAAVIATADTVGLRRSGSEGMHRTPSFLSTGTDKPLDTPAFT